MATSNPILKNFRSADRPDRRAEEGDHMTLTGTITKTISLLVLLGCIASLTSTGLAAWIPGHRGRGPYLLVTRTFAACFFGAIAIVLLTLWKKWWSPLMAPIFAIVEGIALGIASAAIDVRYPGVALQAVSLTVLMCVCLLVAYGAGWIAFTTTFGKKLSVAIAGVVAYCVGSLLLMLAGARGLPILAAGIRGGLVSLVIITAAGMVLIATCDAAVQRTSEGKPKYFEWYAALGILVSLVWIYYEMLEALSKARRTT